MVNPIQYRNTDNPSQIQGWVSHHKGVFVKRPLSLWYAPQGIPGGLMKTFHRYASYWNAFFWPDVIGTSSSRGILDPPLSLHFEFGIKNFSLKNEEK